MLNRIYILVVIFIAINVFGLDPLFAQQAVPPANFAEKNAGTAENPYKIATLENLYWIAAPGTSTGSASGDSAPAQVDRWAACYIQTADIDASATKTWNGEGWKPIGNFINNFTGKYNGDNHTIDGLYINRPGAMYQGLFGITEGALIQNVILTNVNIQAYFYVGGLAGSNSNSTIENSRCSGSVFGDQFVGGLSGSGSDLKISNSSSISNVTGNSNAGGLLGYSSNSTITNCSGIDTVNGSMAIGGLIGLSSNSTIISSFSVCRVGGSYTGGLVGINNQTLIKTSYSTGSVIGTQVAGGLVGSNTASVIEDSYCISYVSGSNFVGGLAGMNDNSTLKNCYSSSNINDGGGDYSGGLTASNSSNSVINNCFWDVTNNASQDNGIGTAKINAEMKKESTYLDAGWSSDIWKINPDRNDGFPYLNWQHTNETP